MKQIGKLLENYLDKFRVFPPESLFEPDWKMITKYRCPVCFNKLKFMRTKEMVYCKSRKHKKPFLISNKKLMTLFTSPI